MPPRKRARISRAASSTPASQPKTPTPAESSPEKTNEQLLNDPWTDDEEIALFKGLIRYKPTGIHKHFHLLALHQSMLDGGHIHPRNEHTKPAGIWRKLQTLYNLDALDEREDARQLERVEIPKDFRGEKTSNDEGSSDASDDADVYSEAANKIENEDFELPGDEFAQMKWTQRLATEKPRKNESPAVLPELNLAGERPVAFKPSFSIEPSEAATPTSRRGRPRAGTGGMKGRPAAVAAASARRSTRQAESVEQQEEDEGGEEDEESEEGQDESAASTPATRSAKGARSRASTTSKTRSRARRR